MSMFQQPRRRKIPALNTASLPDLIFTMLFFFMIVTHMRTSTPQSTIGLPQGQRLEKIRKESGKHTIYIGIKEGRTYIQLDEQVVPAAQLTASLSRLCQSLSPQERQDLVMSLGIDNRVRMHTVEEVKQALRKARILQINYVATEQK